MIAHRAVSAALVNPLAMLPHLPARRSLVRLQAAALPSLGRLVRALVAAVAIVAAFGFIALTAVPRTGLYATFTVLSASMEPAIPMGSVVLVRKADLGAVRVGDVITFSSALPPHPTLSHRVVAVQDTGEGPVFKTKGDANIMVDPWEVKYAGKAGKVILAIPVAGYLMNATQNQTAQAALGLLLAGTLALWWLRTIWRSRPAAASIAALPSSRVERARHVGSGTSVVRTAILCWLLWNLLVAAARHAVR